ncbi:MAG: hypothetical protein DRJ38_05900 [Thermoprotei archaeon]|nr:MAG: hypothetical protein DRJ38_05900 [Thermoprotei archaeon]
MIIEGDFIETVEKLIFDVKGLVHPPDRIIAYVRYIPDKNGDRIREGVRYRKIYALREREEFLNKRYPHYLYKDPVFNTLLQTVPKRYISRIFKPSDRLREMLNSYQLDSVEKNALELALLIKEKVGLNLENIGVTGSVLVKLHKENSDLDLIIIGEREGRKTYEAMEELFEENSVEKYNMERLWRLYEFRSLETPISFEDFVRIEKRKLLQGLFKNRDFYIRLVKKPEEYGERYGDRIYTPLKYVEIKARILNAEDSIFTPCRYIVDVLKGDSRIEEIASYRGRFCEVAKEEEVVEARGKLEKVIDKKRGIYYRLLLGSSGEDYMILLKST